jgi:uncharacterized protein YcbK (DUF882 family)
MGRQVCETLSEKLCVGVTRRGKRGRARVQRANTSSTLSLAQSRPKTSRFSLLRAGTSCGLALAVFLFGSKALQNAVAEGETRTISMHHLDTKENITITYMREGRYDEAALEKINWFLRDWRRSKETRMDPHLIDLLWEVHRETGSKEPINIVCGYRSPATNAMLRRSSHGVARYSQHMLGHAVDFYIPGVPLTEIRVIGLRMQRGGVGFYPTSGSPFVHMDTGGVRMWPRMTREQLLNVFPDGRTAYVPRDGHPLPGYALALADLKKRGQDPKMTWSEEARARGLDKTIVLASDAQQRGNPVDRYYDMSQADTDEDAREDAREATGDTVSAKAEPVAPSAAQATGQAADGALLAALEREAARWREAKLLRNAAPSEHSAFYQTAAFVEPAAAAEASSNGDAAPRTAKAPSAGAMRLAASAVFPAVTGASADASGPSDRVAPDLALPDAEHPQQQAANAQSPVPRPPTATTIAIKRTGDQPFSTIVTAPDTDGAPAVAASPRADGVIVENNPWVDAVMVSPSVARLTVLALGEPDFLALAPLVEKPAQTVTMLFSKDPNPGLAADHFSGSAVVFMSTVTYQQQRQDLALH